MIYTGNSLQEVGYVVSEGFLGMQFVNVEMCTNKYADL